MPTKVNALLCDRLRELGNIGCGHALLALSKLTSTEFFVRVPDIAIIEYREMVERLGDAQEETLAVTLDVHGDLDGTFLLLIKPEIASHILSLLGVETPENFHALSTRQLSAILELGNILCSSYMTAVAQMTDFEIRFSVPAYAVDMLGSILNAPMARFAESEAQLLYIQNVFTIEGHDWIGSILFLPALRSAHALSERLGVLL